MPTKMIRQLESERNIIRDPCTCSAVSKLISKFEETGSVVIERHWTSSLEEERQETVDGLLRDAEGKTSVDMSEDNQMIQDLEFCREMKLTSISMEA